MTSLATVLGGLRLQAGGYKLSKQVRWCMVCLHVPLASGVLSLRFPILSRDTGCCHAACSRFPWRRSAALGFWALFAHGERRTAGCCGLQCVHGHASQLMSCIAASGGAALLLGLAAASPPLLDLPLAVQVLYFNKPPTPQEVLGSLFKGLSGQGQAGASSAAASSAGGPPPGVQTLIRGAASGGSMAADNGGDGAVVLVTGATGGVGRRVVARLLAAGRRVRALVRDVPKAQELLSGLPAGSGGRLELAAADLTQAATLQPAFFEGVGAVVCCHAVKVVPEGDDADRSRYYQVREQDGPGCQLACRAAARQQGARASRRTSSGGARQVCTAVPPHSSALPAPSLSLCPRRASSFTTHRLRVGWAECRDGQAGPTLWFGSPLDTRCPPWPCPGRFVSRKPGWG